MSQIKTKHKMMNSPLYKPWQNMKNRCRNPKTTHYKDYGGRGITYCEKWETFEGFYEDMWPSYEKGLTLDRIDVNGNYCKDNCRWATIYEQANNKRRNLIYTYNGETDTLKNLCRLFNKDYSLILQRVRRQNLDIVSAMEMPLHPGIKTRK
jgi:hypothetical protein